MSASPKSDRSQPARNFKDYTLSKTSRTDLNFMDIPEKSFLPWPDSSGVGDGGLGTQSSSFVSMVQLGFDFKFNGVTYKELTATIAGIAILIDPNSSAKNSVTPGNFYINELYPVVTLSHANSLIKSTFGTIDATNNKHVILALWHDTMCTGFSSLEYAKAGGYAFTPAASSQTVNDLKYGLMIPDNKMLWDEYSYAVRYARTDTPSGKAFVIRWDAMSGLSSAALANFDLSRLKFELVLFENGTIQYRYAKRNKGTGNIPFKRPYTTAAGLAPPVDEGTVGATIGIFANWSGWNFRDFSVGLGYRDSERKIYENGGSIYDASYSDTGTNYYGDTATVPYTCNLDPLNHWPSQKTTFTIYTFSPPVYRRRQKKAVINLRDSVSFLDRESSAFNDQRTVNFTSQRVQYPSMLPTGYRLSNNDIDPISVIQMYQSGSIETTRTITPGLFDSVFFDSVIDNKKRTG